MANEINPLMTLGLGILGANQPSRAPNPFLSVLGRGGINAMQMMQQQQKLAQQAEQQKLQQEYRQRQMEIMGAQEERRKSEFDEKERIRGLQRGIFSRSSAPGDGVGPSYQPSPEELFEAELMRPQDYFEKRFGEEDQLKRRHIGQGIFATEDGRLMNAAGQERTSAQYRALADNARRSTTDKTPEELFRQNLAVVQRVFPDMTPQEQEEKAFDMVRKGRESGREAQRIYEERQKTEAEERSKRHAQRMSEELLEEGRRTEPNLQSNVNAVRAYFDEVAALGHNNKNAQYLAHAYLASLAMGEGKTYNKKEAEAYADTLGLVPSVRKAIGDLLTGKPSIPPDERAHIEQTVLARTNSRIRSYNRDQSAKGAVTGGTPAPIPEVRDAPKQNPEFEETYRAKLEARRRARQAAGPSGVWAPGG